MILSDRGIRKSISAGDLVVEPLTDQSVQPASVDCRLGRHFLRMKKGDRLSISLREESSYEEVESDRFVMGPHSFILATTMEYIKLPDNMISFVEGRSSIGRMGLFIQNAGWVDPGFQGRITLELYNANSLPIELEAGRRICQLVFGLMDQSAQNPYRGKYQGQKQTVGSRIFRDVETLGSSL